ncbi:L10-interacting MYB domain-containing protein-like protein [Tanacetum coccineum]
MAEVDLSPGAISMLLSGRYTVMFKPVVQLIHMKGGSTHTEVNSNGVEQHARYKQIVLSDGSVCTDVFIGYEIDEMIRSKKLQIGSIVSDLTQYISDPLLLKIAIYISVDDLKVIRYNCIILGDPKPFSGNKTPSVNRFIPPKVEEEPLDPDVNDDRHHADEPTAPRQKCSSCSQTQSRKRQRQSSDNKEDGEIGACFEKLEKLGWGEGPMYDTVVLLFGESSDYRKIWLHLKPKSCVNWVKNAGVSDHDHADPDLNEDVNDSHRGEEPPALNQSLSDSTQKCSSHSITQSNKKRKRQSSNDNTTFHTNKIKVMAVNLTP